MWKILENDKDEAMQKASKDEQGWQEDAVEYLLKNFLHDNPKRTCIDAGASYGWFTVPFSNIFHSVKAFEPRKDVFHCFIENTKDIDNIKGWDIACGDENKICYMNYHEKTGLSRIMPNKTDNPVTQKTIDSFNFTDVDFIKLDVEGHEHNALLGAIETIKKYKPLLMVEIHCTRQEGNFNYRQSIFKLLKSLGYEIKDVRASDFIFEYAGVAQW